LKEKAVLYTLILCYSKIALSKSDPTLPIDLNTPVQLLKGVLLLFEDPASDAMCPAFGQDSVFYCSPHIMKVQVTVKKCPTSCMLRDALERDC